MKRILSLTLTLLLIGAILVGCAPQTPVNDNTKIRIGYMAGPTGMGMAKLVADNGGLENGNEKYSFTKYADTGAAKADLAAGKIDVICLPTNEAALYYNTQGKNVQVLAINCLNSLYVLTDNSTEIKSLSELNGETIYTCKNGTPRAIIEHIVKEANINATISYTYDGKEILTPADLGAQITAGNLPIAVVPEPVVTSSLLAIEKNGDKSISYSVDIDITDEWKNISQTPITMGCIIAKSDFVIAHKTVINRFLDEYKESINYISDSSNLDSAANYIVETEVMAAPKAAKKALSNLDDAISYVEGREMRDSLINFYTAINLTIYPDENFYYEK